MSPQDRELKKQLLVIKGEALRTKLKLEWGLLHQHPLGLAEAGLKSWAGARRIGKLAETLATWFPDGKLQHWLRRAAQLSTLWQLARRLLARR